MTHFSARSAISLWVLGAGLTNGGEGCPRLRHVESKMRAPRPDLSSVTSPGLRAALQDPERLWAFITAPETPYIERRAAALRGKRVLPLEWIPRLMSARRELELESSVHHWGLKPHPFSALPYLPDNASDENRVRNVLGHTYVLPEKQLEHPLSWEEEAAAPWPWQVHQTLEALFQAIVPRGGDPDRAAQWLDMTMRMPVTSDEEALLFGRASAAPTHFKTLPVMARWRMIALEPAFPQAAHFLAGRIAEAVRLWDDPRSHLVGRVVLNDILRHGPHRQAREQAAYAVPRMREQWKGGKTVRGPESPSLIIAASDRATDPQSGNEWTRLYVYVFSVCDALDNPPIVPERGMRTDRRYYPQSPENSVGLQSFERWYLTNKDRLTAAAAKENAELQRMRTELIQQASSESAESS